MRVLHILEATAGGTRRHVLDLLPQLQKRGLQCTLIFSAARNPGFRRDALKLQSDNIDTYEIPMGHAYARGSDLHALRELHRHLQQGHYDLIHCHSSNAGMLGRLANAASRRSTPLVYTPHYIALAAGVPRLQRRAALYLEKILKPQTAYYIAVSHHEQALMRRVLQIPPERLSIIHNGIDVSRWHDLETEKTKPEISNQSFSIGCFGRLTEQKNQQLLIRALPAILRKIPHARLKLVGSGEDKSTLRALAEHLNCDNCVDFIQSIPDPHDEYFECDLVAHPSRWEGCSYSLLEAAAAGRAIIASTAGGNSEVIGRAGVLLPAHGASRWAKTIIHLAQNEHDRANLGRAARERVASHFRLSVTVEKTLKVYSKTV